jgi:hypothetical protein
VNAGNASVTLNYLAPSARPVIYSAGPGAPETRLDDEVDPQVVVVRDARLVAEGFSIDREGFRLIKHRSAVSNFSDEAQLRTVYAAEVEAIVQRETGAAHVAMFDPTRRTSSLERSMGVGAPVLRVHNDFTNVSAKQIVRDLFPRSVDQLLHKRFAIVQIWQPTERAVESFPLAIADSRTIAPADLVVAKRRYPGWEGESHLVVYRPCHAWYWVPRMLPDDAFILKGYDSRLDGQAAFSVHTAFTHPSDSVTSRESIEARVLAFFD